MEPVPIFERIVRQVLIGQHPEWRLIRLRANTWKLMRTYRVVP